MKKIIFPLAIVLVTLFGCSQSESNAKSMEQLYKENGVPVKVQTIHPQDLNAEKTFHAVLSGIKESSASAMVADKVEKIYYSVGDVVAKDAIVISFPVDNPSAKYNQAKVGYEHAEATMQRMKNLYESGGISLQDFENTKTQYEVAKSNWQAAKQTVKVKAPISGTITQINVQESDNVHPGDILFTVSQTNKLKTKIWVSEDDIVGIKTGDKVTAKWAGNSITGMVTQVDMSLNAHNQAFGVMVELNNSGTIFKSGVNAELAINSKLCDNTIVVQRKNILQQGHENIVFVAADGSAAKRSVELGQATGIVVQVTRGLNAGDQLIIQGQMLLTDGDKISIQN